VSVYPGDRSHQPFEAAFPSGEAAYMEGVRGGQRLFWKKLPRRRNLRVRGVFQGAAADKSPWRGRIARRSPASPALPKWRFLYRPRV